MRIVNAPRRLALDTVGYFTPYCKAMASNGPGTVFRYINYNKSWRETPDTSGDWLISLSKQELGELLEASWNVGIVQVGIGRKNKGGAAAGTTVGEAAVYNANGLGIPEGATIFCDCEWSESVVPSKNKQAAYINAWCAVVKQAGYIPGLYVSPELAFTSAELYSMLYAKAYWKSASAVPAIDVRGPQIIQSLEYFFEYATGALYPWSDSCYSRKGLRLDMDMLCIDGKGERVKVISA